MSNYRNRFFAHCTLRDLDGALEHVRTVFDDPRNALPAKAKVSMSAGFDAIVSGFKPQAAAGFSGFAMRNLRAGRGERADREHALSPFNALWFRMHMLDFCQLEVQSVHWNPGSTTFEPRFDFEELIVDDEASDEDSFTFDLFSRERLHAGNETVSGTEAYRQIKAVLFARYVRELAAVLRQADEFARFPKALPFHFIFEMQHDPESSASFVFEAAAIEPTVADPVLGPLFREAAKPLPVPTKSAREPALPRDMKDPAEALLSTQEYVASGATGLEHSKNPLVRVMWFEKTLPAGTRPHYVKYPPRAYIESVIACLDVLPPNYGEHPELWSFVLDRLEALEERAHAAITRLEKIFRAQLRLAKGELRALSHNFGQVLFWIGMEEIPAPIRAAQKRWPGVMPFYADWEKRSMRPARKKPPKKKAAERRAKK